MVNPNNTNAAAVARVRSEIDEARLELHRLRAAPFAGRRTAGARCSARC
jgi:hypothetical protein